MIEKARSILLPKTNKFKMLPWLVVIFLSLEFSINVTAKDFKYENYSTMDGMASNYIECMLHDSQGFLWVGSWNGLNRFDGYNFRQYQASVYVKGKISGNWVRCLHEDQKGEIWVGTNDGLSKYDKIKDQFYNYLNLFNNINIFDIQDAERNKLWISSDSGLYLFDTDKERIDKQYSDINSTHKIPSHTINGVATNGNDEIWIATNGNGLIRLNNKTENFTVFKHTSGKNFITSDILTTLTFDKKGNLWIGTDNGISILDTQNLMFCSKKNENLNTNSLGSNNIKDIICDHKGDMWIACKDGYLNKYDEKHGSFTRLVNYKYTMRTPFPISVNTIEEDHLGNIWAGTLGDGIFCMNPYINQFRSFISLENGKSAVLSNRVLSFAETDDGNILIGTDGNGVGVFNQKTENVNFINKSNGLPSNAITCINRISDDEIWISTWNGGISLYDHTSKQILKSAYLQTINSKLDSKEIKYILKEKDNFWIATSGLGISVFQKEKNKFFSYQNQHKTPFEMELPKWCNSFLKDSKGRIWMTSYYLLYMYDGKQLHKYKYDENNPKSINSDQTFSIIEDWEKNIWIVTSRGIVKYEEETDGFINYSEKYGLPEDARSIVEDKNHNFWISTGNGLTFFNPTTKKITIYSKDEGLGENDYSFNSAFSTKAGNILFGGMNGFVMFNPDSLISSPNIPNVVIENLYVDYKLQHLGDSGCVLRKSIETTDTLYLDYSNAIISFDFAGLDLSNPKSLSYSYQIKGLNDNWISLGKERKVTLSNLAPGTYVLLVRATKPNGISGTNGDGLIIKVRPPWWMTWWFYASICMLGICFIFALFKYRVSRIQKRNKKLEAIVDSRTFELTGKNKELRELNDTKDKLFSIIAHDLRNPINVLMGVAELMIERFDTLKEDKKKDYIGRIFESSKNIHALLEQLLNWAMSQSYSIHFDWQDTDVNRIISEAVSLENEMAFKKNITIETDLQTTRTAHHVDPLMISTVVRNLLSNAIKYTNENGIINISTKEVDNRILLSIKDNGIGMTKEQLDHLFSIQRGQSRLGTNNEKGTGLGLIICKEFIEKNNGLLTIESEPGSGSTFTCSLIAGDHIKITEQGNEEHNEECMSTLKKYTFAKQAEDSDLQEKPILLVVEDNVDIAQYISDIFSPNFDVKIAENGKIGWQKCRELIPDIIISDVTMPEMDGEELCRMTKTDSLTNHIPFILLTARNLPQQQINGLQNGADDYITKPFIKQILQERVKSLLNNRALYKDYIKRQLICGHDVTTPAAPGDKFLETVVALIEKNISDPQLSVEFISKEIGVSRVQLYRKFKALTGQSPIDLIKEIKLKKAASLLKTGEWKVSDAAFESGFSDPLYFSKCFQKEFDMTPSQYIKENAPTKEQRE